MKSNQKSLLNRRSFLASGTLGLASIGLATAGNRVLRTEETSGQDVVPDELVESFPVLQNPGPDRMNILWTVKVPATGWVEYGPTESLGMTARPATFGLYPWEERFLAIPLEGLTPDTTYFYRAVTVGMDFPRYAKITATPPVRSDLYSFRTPGSSAPDASFVVVNDTHEATDVLDAATKRILDLDADYTLFNGDLANDTNSADQMVKATVLAGNRPFAVRRPLLVAMGNHDHRGPWARKLSGLILPWNQENPRFRGLGRNFALRKGPLALIGMDTGEDKPDDHPAWSGLSAFTPYRQLQTEWLAETLARPEIASSPFIVVCCHIPLYSSDPNANPGNIREGSAAWQKDCADAWSPLFRQYGVQAVLVAHQHRFCADAPTEDRPWIQVCGGGCNLAKDATLIQGRATADKFILQAEKLADSSPLGSWELSPRS